MATFSDNTRRGRREEPDYTGGTPERHAPKGEGTTKHGDKVHGSVRQPWVREDGVKPDPTSSVDGDGKDVG